MYKTTKTTVASTELCEPVFKEVMIADTAQGPPCLSSLYCLVASSAKYSQVLAWLTPQLPFDLDVRKI